MLGRHTDAPTIEQLAHIRHLKKFIEDSPERIGLLVNMSHSIEKLEHRIWQVPAPQLLA